MHSPPNIPDYELLRLIGRGSYGDVWLARGITGLYRAVKVVWRDRFADAQPFEREFKGLREFAAVSLGEAHQLALLHIGRNQSAGFFYYVMELADDAKAGRVIDPLSYVPLTLKEVRLRRGRLPAMEVITLGANLARALAGLHTRGLVHRDIKPSNVIFIDSSPKLADIGLVTAANTTGTFVGTEGFVPPEGPGAPSADVFSLGKLLYEAATGLDRLDYPRLPPDLSELADRRELLELNEVLIRACELKPAGRYPDADALLDDLLVLQAGRSMRRLRIAERRLASALQIITVLVLVSAIAAAGAYFERQRALRENRLRQRAELKLDELARKSVYTAGLTKSQRALELGDFGHARRQLLELVQETRETDLRGFEWFALLAEAQGDPAVVLRENGASAEKVRFSGDGRMFAIQCADQCVTLWDAFTLKIIRTIPGIHRLVGFSADCQWLVGSDSNLSLQRWGAATGAIDQQPIFGVDRPIASYPDGNCALCFTDRIDGIHHAIRIWSFAGHTDLARLPIVSDTDNAQWDFYRASLSVDSRLCVLALVSGRGFEARWKLQFISLFPPKLLREELLEHLPSSLALSPDGNHLAVAFRDANAIEVRTLSTNTILWRRTLSANPINMIAFAPDGLQMAIAGREHTVRIVDSYTGEVLNELRGHEAGVEDVSWSPDGRHLISVGSAGDLRFWREPSRQNKLTSGGFWTPIARYGNVVTSHNGEQLAVTRDGCKVDILSARTLEVVASVPNALRPIAFIDNGRSLLTLTAKGAVQCWQLEPTLILKNELVLFEGRAAISVSLSQDQHWLAASDSGGKLRIWDWPGRQLIHENSAHAEYVWSVAFSPDGESIATSGADGRTRVWERSTALKRAEWISSTDTNMVQFSPSGRELILALGNGDIELHDPTTLGLTRTLHTGSARANVLTFSPDGSRMLCGAPDGLVHVFSTEDWRELVTLTAATSPKGSVSAVVDLNFSTHANTLAAYLADGHIRVWRW